MIASRKRRMPATSPLGDSMAMVSVEVLRMRCRACSRSRTLCASVGKSATKLASTVSLVISGTVASERTTATRMKAIGRFA